MQLRNFEIRKGLIMVRILIPLFLCVSTLSYLAAQNLNRITLIKWSFFYVFIPCFLSICMYYQRSKVRSKLNWKVELIVIVIVNLFALNLNAEFGNGGDDSFVIVGVFSFILFVFLIEMLIRLFVEASSWKVRK